MITSSGLLFFFSGLGVFNGLILAAYFLFFTKKEELAHKLLGLLLLLLSIRIGKSVVYFFYRDLGEFLSGVWREPRRAGRRSTQGTRQGQGEDRRPETRVPMG